MIKRVYLIRALFLCTAAIAGALVASYFNSGRINTDDRFVFQNTGVNLKDSDKENALRGDLNASGRVLQAIVQKCEFSQNHSKSEKERCLSAEIEWSFVDAENGGPAGAAMLANAYEARGGCDELLRAVYWFSKIKNYGPPYGYVDINRIQKKLSKCGSKQ